MILNTRHLSPIFMFGVRPSFVNVRCLSCFLTLDLMYSLRVLSCRGKGVNDDSVNQEDSFESWTTPYRKRNRSLILTRVVGEGVGGGYCVGVRDSSGRR